MRSRYFLSILAVLTLVAIACIVVHARFQKKVRLKLIDQQVRETAEALIDSKKLYGLRKIDFAESEKIIAGELGESRIGKLFIIRNEKGQRIFENQLAKDIEAFVHIPKQPQWIKFHVKGHYVRILNLEIPKFPNRTLSVGLVMDESLISPSFFSKSTIVFLATILVIGLIGSLFLTSYLLKPLVKLEGFLTKASVQTRLQPQLDRVPSEIVGDTKSKDEFLRMVAALNTLIDRVNSNYRFSRLWAYQMAHELKTPLSILTLEIEKIRGQVSRTNAIRLVKESNKISDTINSFLGWAELENSNMQKRLFANRLGVMSRKVAERFSFSHPDRVSIEIFSDPVVMAAPQHLEQLISNLLSNAIAYSDENVILRVTNRSLNVIDKGLGIPKEVLDRLGEPFNRGSAGVGHGLGLAWVKSICRIYDWQLGVFPSDQGSHLIISFPPAEALSMLERSI